MKFLKFSIPVLMAVVLVTSAEARKQNKFQQEHPLTPEQAALVEKSVGQEKILVKSIQQRTPLVEYYIQETRPDAALGFVPVKDVYSIGRVDFGKGFSDNTYSSKDVKTKHGFFGGTKAFFGGMTKALGLGSGSGYNASGIMQMMFIDPYGFDQQHYTFSYVRHEFLGSVRTWVYDVHPKQGTGEGRFIGRIWIEDEGGNVVRFNGTFSDKGSDARDIYFHFDSWRSNIQPGEWLPVAVYVEETQGNAFTKNGIRAQVRYWGYSLRLPQHESDNVSIKVEGANDESENSQDLTPLEASRKWVGQAENNVIDRLVQAGLVAPASPFDATLEQIVTNISVPNNLNFSEPVHCRVLLTTTVEATSIGNTILVSRGLIDTLPNEESMASAVAFELAHVALGHHVDTRYAFNDRLLFPDEASFKRITMNHTPADNEAAAKKAVEFLQNSMYKDKLGNAGLYYLQLADRGKVLKDLNTPRLGDSYLKADGTPWLSELTKGAPKLDQEKLDQWAAYPLGSWLKVNAWDDKVTMLNAKRYTPMNARDKMPLLVTPVYFRLQRYEEAEAQAAQQAAPPAAPPADGAAPATQGAAPSGDTAPNTQPQNAPAQDQAPAQTPPSTQPQPH